MAPLTNAVGRQLGRVLPGRDTGPVGTHSLLAPLGCVLLPPSPHVHRMDEFLLSESITNMI